VISSGEGAAAGVPALVRRHVERAVDDVPPPRQVLITQEGEMWLRPGARGMRFAATQRFAVERVALSWRARFPVAGPLALHVVDRFADDDGELAVRLLGLPVQRQRGTETAAGEALRYLAELPWAPHALLHNRKLEWRDLDARRTEVATRVRGHRLTVELAADESGDIVRSSSRMRQRKIAGEWVATPWGGNFDGYEKLGGIRVPTFGEAYWDLPEGRYVYFRAHVRSVELLEQPFGNDP
jgi:hypothetical protein